MDSQISKLSTLQLNVHGLETDDGKLVYKSDVGSESLFSPSIDTLMHYSYFAEEMKITANGNTLRADVNMEHDNLIAMAIRRVVPNIYVRDEYKGIIQICLSENLIMNSIPIIEMKWGPVSSKHLSKINDAFVEHIQRRNNRFILHLAGNRKELINWSEHIPSCPMEMIPLWYWYRGGTATSLPLFLKRTEQLSFIFSFAFENSLLKFIRMRKIVNPGSKGKKKYEPIPFDPKYIRIDEDVQKIFSTPYVTGFYIKRLQDDLNSILKKASCYPDNNPMKIEYPFEDIGQVGETTVKGYNDPATFKVETDFVSKNIIILAENFDSAIYSCYSNYSTNPIDPYSGDYPIGSVTLKDEANRTEKVYDITTILTLMSMHFGKSPRKFGIIMIPFTLRPCEVEDTNGKALAMNNIKIVVNLVDQTPGGCRDPNQKFRISVYLQNWRKHVFTYDKKKEAFIQSLI